eukprot:341522-Chlamydomonas_euryale.AAC.1
MLKLLSLPSLPHFYDMRQLTSHTGCHGLPACALLCCSGWTHAWKRHQPCCACAGLGLPSRDTSAPEPVTPPLPAGNYEEPTETCLLDVDLQQIVVEADSVGWGFVNEGTAEKPKTGFVSTTPGTKLVRMAAQAASMAGGAALVASAAGQQLPVEHGVGCVLGVACDACGTRRWVHAGHGVGDVWDVPLRQTSCVSGGQPSVPQPWRRLCPSLGG